MPITLTGPSSLSGPMSFVAGAAGGAVSAPPAWSGSSAGTDAYYIGISTSITILFNSDGTISDDAGGYGGGQLTRWFTGTPTASDYEIQFIYTVASTDGTHTTTVGPVGSATSLAASTTSSWFNLANNIQLKNLQVTGTTTVIDCTVTIRQVSVPANSITKIFTLDHAA